MSLVFYDTETTGTETFFDQILQFAAIRTDEQLNEIDRLEIRCRVFFRDRLDQLVGKDDPQVEQLAQTRAVRLGDRESLRRRQGIAR